jgi:tRNA U38,U39,U40 pseudouridine synthase TruA
MNASHKVDLEATKHVLHNIKGIHEFGIFCEAKNSNGLRRFTDLDWAGDCEEQKSTTCYLFQLGKWTNHLVLL